MTKDFTYGGGELLSYLKDETDRERTKREKRKQESEEGRREKEAIILKI